MKRGFLILTLFIFFQIDILGENFCYWTRLDPVYDSLSIQMEKVSFEDGDRQTLIPVVGKMYRMAREKQSPLLQARTYYWDASLQLSVDRDSAYSLISKAVEMIDTVKYGYDYARMLLVKADVLRNKGDWMHGYRLCKRVEVDFKQYKDIFYLAKTYVVMGVILRELQEYEIALKYLLKGEEAFEKVGSLNCATKNKLNISNTLYQLGRKAEASRMLKSLVNNPLVRSDTAFLVNALISCYSVSDLMEKKYAFEAHRLAQLSGNRHLVSMALVSIGASMLMEKENDSALYYYKKAYSNLAYNDYKSNLFPTLCGLSEAYSRLNRLDSAYYYLREYETCRDSLLARDKIIEVNRFESRLAVEKYESDINRAKEKARWQTKITWIVSCSLITLSLLVFYILWLSRKKEKIKKQLKEAENRELMLQNKQFLGEIDSKNRELTSNTLVISEKNQALKGLLKIVEEMVGRSVLPSKEANVLKGKIREHLLHGDEWQYFKLHFENVHPYFFSRLKEISPTLSENDLRFCAYIRIGMESKQLALMLSVQPDTIFTTRYRIRKKMGLGQHDSLEDFLRTLS